MKAEIVNHEIGYGVFDAAADRNTVSIKQIDIADFNISGGFINGVNCNTVITIFIITLFISILVIDPTLMPSVLGESSGASMRKS